MNYKKTLADLPEPAAPPRQWVELLQRRLKQGKTVFFPLPGGGRVHLDRPLPFLCIYRKPSQALPAGTEELVTSQAAYVLAFSGRDRQIQRSLTHWLAGEIVRRYGAILILELWIEPDAADNDEGDFRPRFEIRLPRHTEKNYASAAMILEKTLGRIRVHQQSASVAVVSDAPHGPPGLPPLIRPNADSCVCHVGLQVRPVFVNWESGALFPLLFQDLREQLAVAFKVTFFEFDRDHTTHGSSHFHALGRRSITPKVLGADRELEACSSAFEFLLQVTPSNSEAAWRAFQRSHFQKTPRFTYRPLTVDPELIKRRIYSLPIEEVKDPTLGVLLRRKREEIDRQVTMLFDRDTPRFLHGSVQLYGGVGEDLRQLAEKILSDTTAEANGTGKPRRLTDRALAQRAEREIAYYRGQYKPFNATVAVRSDIPPGVMVSGCRLLIGAGTRMPPHRVVPILHHEVGTHLLTYFNGAAQPLKQLRSGLAGYEELQEGLATFSEYLAGGLTTARMRLLAARVVAVYSLLDGARFIDVFNLLHTGHGLEPRSSFLVAMRVFRGGGFTKDAIYLRGLRDLVEYLRGRGELATLLIGKIAFDHIPLIEELRERGVVRPPPLLPRYLNDEDAKTRLAAVQRGLPLISLIQPNQS